MDLTERPRAAETIRKGYAAIRSRASLVKRVPGSSSLLRQHFTKGGLSLFHTIELSDRDTLELHTGVPNIPETLDAPIDPQWHSKEKNDDERELMRRALLSNESLQLDGNKSQTLDTSQLHKPNQVIECINPTPPKTPRHVPQPYIVMSKARLTLCRLGLKTVLVGSIGGLSNYTFVYAKQGPIVILEAPVVLRNSMVVLDDQRVKDKPGLAEGLQGFRV